MPTLIEGRSAEQSAALARELGLGFVELNMNLPGFQPEVMDLPGLKRIAGKSGIFYTLHLDENLNFCDWNGDVRAAYLRTALRAVEIAREIGAPLVNFHLPRGVYFTLPEGKVYLFRQYLELMQEARDALTAAAGADVLISVENTNGFLDFQKDALEMLLQSPAFGITYDVGHDFSAGGRDGDWMLCRDRFRHMHLHDAGAQKITCRWARAGFRWKTCWRWRGRKISAWCWRPRRPTDYGNLSTA